MDSLMAVELKSLLEKDTAMALPSTLTFNYPTVVELAGFFSQRLSADEESGPVDNSSATENEKKSVAEDPDKLSEEDLTEMLKRKLEELK
jgi:hypothetical protein